MDWLNMHSWIEAGRSEMAILARKMLFRLSPEIFKVLNFEDDSDFFSPFVFSNPANASDPNHIELSLLSQVLRSCRKLPKPIIAQPNSEGIIFIPVVGYLHLNDKWAKPVKLRAVFENSWLVELDGVPAPHVLDQIKTIGAYPFGLVEYITPIFGSIVVEDIRGNATELNDEQVIRGGAPSQMVEAMSHIRNYESEYYKAMEMSTDYFVLFDSSKILI